VTFTFSVLEVVFPERADLLLAADIKDSKREALHGGDRLHVEPDGGDRGHRLVQLQLVQHRRLAWNMNHRCNERLMPFKIKVLNNYFS